MTLADDLDRLITLGVPALAHLTDDEFASLADGLVDHPGAVLAVHPSLVAAADLVPLLRGAGGQEGFVVTDLTDLDEFVTIPR